MNVDCTSRQMSACKHDLQCRCAPRCRRPRADAPSARTHAACSRRDCAWYRPRSFDLSHQSCRRGRNIARSPQSVRPGRSGGRRHEPGLRRDTLSAHCAYPRCRDREPEARSRSEARRPKRCHHPSRRRSVSLPRAAAGFCQRSDGLDAVQPSAARSKDGSVERLRCQGAGIGRGR